MTNPNNTNDRFFHSVADNFTICVEKLSLKQARDLIKEYVPNDDSTIDILYKDGTMVSLTSDSDENTKVKLINIMSVVECNPCTFMVYGNFEINDNLIVSPDFEEKIDGSIIEVDNWEYDSNDSYNEKTHKYTCKCVSSVHTEKNVTKLIKLATVFSKCKKICTAYERKLFSVKLFNFVNCYNGKQHINKVAVNSKVTYDLAKDIVTKYKSKDNTVGLDIITLCIMLVHSRLKKLILSDTTYKKEWYKMKSDIVRVQFFETMVKQYNTLFVNEYNTKGKLTVKCIDHLNAMDIQKNIADLHDCKGYDIVSTAIVKLLDILHNMPIDSKSTYLTDTFETYRERSKFDKNGDLRPIELWKKDSTNYIREISKEISRYINSERTVMVSTDIYDIKECVDENNETYIMYKKVTNQLDKLAYTSYCNSDIVDVNNDDRLTIANMVNDIKSKCGLTVMEKTVFSDYFIKGKTIEYIASKLERDNSTIKTYISRIRTKIINSGIFGNISKSASFTAAHTEISVSVYDIHNKLIGIYSSIGVCSKALGLDKSTVAKRIKKGGDATPYKGYYFKVNVK